MSIHLENDNTNQNQLPLPIGKSVSSARTSNSRPVTLIQPGSDIVGINVPNGRSNIASVVERSTNIPIDGDRDPVQHGHVVSQLSMSQGELKSIFMNLDFSNIQSVDEIAKLIPGFSLIVTANKIGGEVDSSVKPKNDEDLKEFFQRNESRFQNRELTWNISGQYRGNVLPPALFNRIAAQFLPRIFENIGFSHLYNQKFNEKNKIDSNDKDNSQEIRKDQTSTVDHRSKEKTILEEQQMLRGISRTEKESPFSLKTTFKKIMQFNEELRERVEDKNARDRASDIKQQQISQQVQNENIQNASIHKTVLVEGQEEKMSFDTEVKEGEVSEEKGKKIKRNDEPPPSDEPPRVDNTTITKI